MQQGFFRCSHSGASCSKHREVAFLAAALLFYAIGYCWTIGVLSQYLVDLSCLRLHGATFSECQNLSFVNQSQWEEVTVDANNLDTRITIPSSIMMAIMAPVLCSLSDFVGRKPILILTMLCASCLSLSIAVVPYHMFATLAPWISTGTGLGGGLFCYLAVTFARIVDVFAAQSPKTRAVFIGRVEAFCWMGLCIGPFLGSWISKWVAPDKNAENIQKTFWFAFGFQIAGVVMLIFGLRERCRLKKKFSCLSMIPYGPIWKLGSSLRNLLWITLANAFVQLAASCGVELLPDFIFAYDKSPDDLSIVSYTFTVYFGCCGLAELLLLPLVSKCLTQRIILMSAIIATGVSWSLFGVAAISAQSWLLWVAAAACCLNSLVFPVVRTFITQSLGREHHGNGLGLLAFLEAAGGVLAPFLERWLWSKEVELDVQGKKGVRGMCFFVFGAIALLGFICVIFVKFSQNENDEKQIHDKHNDEDEENSLSSSTITTKLLQEKA